MNSTASTLNGASQMEILNGRLQVQAQRITELETALTARRALDDARAAENTRLRAALRKMLEYHGRVETGITLQPVDCSCDGCKQTRAALQDGDDERVTKNTELRQACNGLLNYIDLLWKERKLVYPDDHPDFVPAPIRVARAALAAGDGEQLTDGDLAVLKSVPREGVGSSGQYFPPDPSDE